MRNRAWHFLENRIEKRAVRRWDRLVEAARTISPARLRRLKHFATVIAPRVDAIRVISEKRLGPEHTDAAFLGLPVTTDWADRPDIWDRATLSGGIVASTSPTTLDDRVALYHDGGPTSLTLRQRSNASLEDQSQFGLQCDIYDFDGSFLSLVIKAASGMVAGLTSKHILRVTTNISAEHAISGNLRLNLKHGPNTEQIEKPLTISEANAAVDFDLAYIPFNEARVEEIWFDLFFDSGPMNMIRINGLTLSRHTRADI